MATASNHWATCSWVVATAIEKVGLTIYIDQSLVSCQLTAIQNCSTEYFEDLSAVHFSLDHFNHVYRVVRKPITVMTDKKASPGFFQVMEIPHKLRKFWPALPIQFDHFLCIRYWESGSWLSFLFQYIFRKTGSIWNWLEESLWTTSRLTFQWLGLPKIRSRCRRRGLSCSWVVFTR